MRQVKKNEELYRVDLAIELRSKENRDVHKKREWQSLIIDNAEDNFGGRDRRKSRISKRNISDKNKRKCQGGKNEENKC